MGSRVTQTPLMIQDENARVVHKKGAIDGNTKNFKTAAKKGGVGLGGRKALNDITNKSVVRQEVVPKRKEVQKEEFNIAEEKFLHDHQKCIEAQQASRAFNLDLVLPRFDSSSIFNDPESKAKEKAHIDSLLHDPEPVELPMSEFSDWFDGLTKWNSPPSSPIQWDTPPCSPLFKNIGEVEFVLKEEEYV